MCELGLGGLRLGLCLHGFRLSLLCSLFLLSGLLLGNSDLTLLPDVDDDDYDYRSDGNNSNYRNDLPVRQLLRHHAVSSLLQGHLEELAFVVFRLLVVVIDVVEEDLSCLIVQDNGTSVISGRYRTDVVSRLVRVLSEHDENMALILAEKLHVLVFSPILETTLRLVLASDLFARYPEIRLNAGLLIEILESFNEICLFA